MASSRPLLDKIHMEISSQTINNFFLRNIRKEKI